MTELTKKQLAHRAYYQKNKEKIAQQVLKWKSENPERVKVIIERHKKTLKYSEARRRWFRKKYYGLSDEKFMEMQSQQNHLCAICGFPETKIGKLTGLPVPLSVDHDHKTGKIRSLLCNSCNKLLGDCKENENVLLSAIQYLRKYSNAY